MRKRAECLLWSIASPPPPAPSPALASADMSSATFWLLILILAPPCALIQAKGMRYNPNLPDEDDDVELHLRPTGHCAGSTCFSQLECCEGAICVTHSSSKVGVCAKLLAQSEGKLCLTTPESNACAPGLVCQTFHRDFFPLGYCVNPNHAYRKRKQYFETCETSMDCETDEALCCRFQPASPSRSSARNICSYFQDPLEDCIF